MNSVENISKKVANMSDNQEYQQAKWQQAESQYEELLDTLNEDNILEIFNKILEINILWTQDILIRLILCYSSQFNLKPNVVAALSSLIYQAVPRFGQTLAEQAILTFIESFNNRRSVETTEMVLLLGEMFNYGICHELVILQTLQILLSKENDPDCMLNIINLLLSCGCKLQELNKSTHDVIFDKLKESVLNNDDMEGKILNRFKELLSMKENNYENIHNISLPALSVGKIDPVKLIIDKNWMEPNNNLGDYRYCENSDTIEEDYLLLKNKVQQVLNENLQDEQANPEQKIGNENIKPETLPDTKNTVSNVNIVRDMTNSQDIEFKKKIYLLLKSSLSGDEAAHKILKLRVPDDEKHKIIEIIIKSSIQEATYSKFYGILAERLCQAHRSWKPAFEKIFYENYQTLETFEPAQLRIIGKFWGHLLSTDYLGFEIFKIIKLNEEDSTPPSRIFIKFIFQELVTELNIAELKERLSEPYIKPYLTNIFPSDDAENIRYAINYFTAIGLGILTEEMRSRLTIIEQEEEEDENEEEEEEDAEDEDVYQAHQEGVDNDKHEVENVVGEGVSRRREVEQPAESTSQRRPSRFSNTTETNERNSRRRRSVTPPRYKRYDRKRSRTPPRSNGRYSNDQNTAASVKNKKNRYQNQTSSDGRFFSNTNERPRSRYNR